MEGGEVCFFIGFGGWTPLCTAYCVWACPRAASPEQSSHFGDVICEVSPLTINYGLKP